MGDTTAGICTNAEYSTVGLYDLWVLGLPLAIINIVFDVSKTVEAARVSVNKCD